MDVYFNGYKCRYELMNKWIKSYSQSMHIKKVNFFINLDDFMRSLFKPNIDNEFEVIGKDAGKQFLSNLFNLLAHYRYWAIKNHYEAKVYGYYSLNGIPDSQSLNRDYFKNQIFIPEYRKKMCTYLSGGKYYYVASAINDCFSLANTICNYIPGVYLIDTEYLEPSIVPEYIASTDDSVADLNFVITRDIYDLQYADRSQWIYISPKGDNSSFIHQGNMWDYINYKEHIYSKEVDLHYPSNMFILARAIVGDSYRGIPRLRSIGWKTLFKYLNQVEKKITSNNYLILEMELRELLKGKMVDERRLSNNLNSIDIRFQVDSMNALDKIIIDSQVIDIEDYENLKMLNQVKLAKYPLNLKFLCDTIQTPLGFKRDQWN